MSARPRTSRLRQSLLRLQDEAGTLLEVFLASAPLVRGSVYELRRRCGRPTCRCARGQLHPVMVISASEQGRTRLRAIPQDRLKGLRELTRSYQRFRRARARLVRVQREMLTVIDHLEAARRKEG
ncbi:MAG: DUF6788 family protein [Gemmatimonadales bacterium]